MQKKLTFMLTACLAASAVWSSSSLAYDNGYQGPHDNGYQGQNKPSYEHGKPSGNEQNNAQKGMLKQLKSIDKQLDKIEQKITKYESKFNKWTDDDDDDDDKNIEDQDQDQDKEKDKDKSKERTDNTQQASQTYLSKNTDDTHVVQEEIQANDSNREDEDEIESDQPESEDKDDDTEEADEQEDELAEEIDEAVEEYNEYTGKFRALNNRLDGVGRQLDSLATRGLDPALITERQTRIEELRSKMNASVEKMTTVQDRVIDKIKNDHAAVEKAPREEKLTTKAWTVHFNKKLDEASLSELIIVVYDEQNQLVETTMTYDAVKKAVIVQPAQPYKIGSRYTLYVGKELSSQGGQKLKNSVKMQFTIR